MPKPKPLHYSNSNPNHSLAPNYSLPFLRHTQPLLHSVCLTSFQKPKPLLLLFSVTFLLIYFILLTTKNCSKPFLRTQPIQNKKHTALTIPVWSPTTVLGKPNPAWLRSSDGIRYIQGGMTVWCRYYFFIALIPKPKNFSFTSSYSLLYYRHSLFFQQTISLTHFFSPIFTTKRFLSPPWFFLQLYTLTYHFHSNQFYSLSITYFMRSSAEFSRTMPQKFSKIS